jgi:hypothetical protein
MGIWLALAGGAELVRFAEIQKFVALASEALKAIRMASEPMFRMNLVPHRKRGEREPFARP